MYSIRILMKKQREHNRPAHGFVDLKKPFDRVPRNLIWHALRAQRVTEYYINLTKNTYHNVTTKVRSLAGSGVQFDVGVHQGSTLSPLLFNRLMNHLTAELQHPSPLDILYADDIVLITEDSNDLQTLDEWRGVLERAGLRVSREKTEHNALGYQ